MMIPIVEQLIGVLEKLERRYEQLLGEMTKEKAATLVSNAEAMDAVVARKQEVIAAMSRLERQRHGLLQQMAAQLRLPLSELNLSTIAAHASPEQASKIDRLGRSLAQLLNKVQTVNDENRALVLHCLGLVQNTLCFFKQWIAPASVYGNSGQIDGGSMSGRLLSGVV